MRSPLCRPSLLKPGRDPRRLLRDLAPAHPPLAADQRLAVGISRGRVRDHRPDAVGRSQNAGTTRSPKRASSRIAGMECCDQSNAQTSDDGNADHDGMEGEGQRQIGDQPDRHRDQVVAGTADRDRRCAGVGAAFQRDPVEHRPAQERAEQDDRAEIAIGEQMRRRPQFDAGQHRMLQRGVDAAADIGGDHQNDGGQHQRHRDVLHRGRRGPDVDPAGRAIMGKAPDDQREAERPRPANSRSCSRPRPSSRSAAPASSRCVVSVWTPRNSTRPRIITDSPMMSPPWQRGLRLSGNILRSGRNALRHSGAREARTRNLTGRRFANNLDSGLASAARNDASRLLRLLAQIAIIDIADRDRPPGRGAAEPPVNFSGAQAASEALIAFR